MTTTPSTHDIAEWMESMDTKVARCETLGEVQQIIDEAVALGFHETHVKAAVSKALRRRIMADIGRS